MDLQQILANFVNTELKEMTKKDIEWDGQYALIKVNDFVYGDREIRFYEYDGSLVCTNWSENGVPQMPSIAYVRCKTQLHVQQFKDTVQKYFKSSYEFWYGSAFEDWIGVERVLGEFAKKHGAYMTTSSILKTPVLSDDQKAALLSYLQLDEIIQCARERDVKIDLHKQKLEESHA